MRPTRPFSPRTTSSSNRLSNSKPSNRGSSRLFKRSTSRTWRTPIMLASIRPRQMVGVTRLGRRQSKAAPSILPKCYSRSQARTLTVREASGRALIMPQLATLVAALPKTRESGSDSSNSSKASHRTKMMHLNYLVI